MFISVNQTSSQESQISSQKSQTSSQESQTSIKNRYPAVNKEGVLNWYATPEEAATNTASSGRTLRPKQSPKLTPPPKLTHTGRKRDRPNNPKFEYINREYTALDVEDEDIIGSLAFLNACCNHRPSGPPMPLPVVFGCSYTDSAL